MLLCVKLHGLLLLLLLYLQTVLGGVNATTTVGEYLDDASIITVMRRKQHDDADCVIDNVICVAEFSVEVCVYYYESSPSPINNLYAVEICMNPQNTRVDRKDWSIGS